MVNYQTFSYFLIKIKRQFTVLSKNNNSVFERFKIFRKKMHDKNKKEKVNGSTNFIIY